MQGSGSGPQSTTVIPYASEWDEAYARVESYLRSHRIQNRVLLSGLVNGIVRRAVDESARRGGDPVTLTMELADRTMADWFHHVLGDNGAAESRLSIRGRLALAMANVPERWPEHFLGPDPLPGELAAAMRDCFLEAGPDLQFTNMAPRPIDLGPIASVAGGTWSTFKKWPLIKGLFLWVLFLSGLGAIFYLTR